MGPAFIEASIILLYSRVKKSENKVSPWNVTCALECASKPERRASDDSSNFNILQFSVAFNSVNAIKRCVSIKTFFHDGPLRQIRSDVGQLILIKI